MDHTHIPSDRQRIIKAIEDYSAVSGLKPTTICQYALRNRRFYANLHRPELDYQAGSAARLLDYIAEKTAQVS